MRQKIYLNLKNNKLIWIPIELGKLVGWHTSMISKLDISCNQITEISEELGVYFTRLSMLNIANNKLKALPISFGSNQWPNIQKLILFGNAFRVGFMLNWKKNGWISQALSYVPSWLTSQSADQSDDLIYYNAQDKTNGNINALLTQLARDGKLDYFDLIHEITYSKLSNRLFDHLRKKGAYHDVIAMINHFR